MQRFPRSMLFTPATLAEHFEAAARASADAIILDLEDAVAPRDKATARRLALEYLETATPTVTTALRINAPTTPPGWQDLTALLNSDADPDYVVVPKADSAAVAGLVRVQLRQARKTSRVIVIAETSAAAARPDALCDPDTVDAILFGADDMCADLGAEPHAAVVDHARNSVLLQAAATRIPVIDSPFFDLADDAGLSAAATAAAAQGFAGKAAIHPKQIGAINSAFTPTTAQIDWAQKVLAANDAGAGTVAGEMVDEAVARRARRILTLTHP